MQAERSRSRAGAAAASSRVMMTTVLLLAVGPGCMSTSEGRRFRGTTAASMIRQINESKDPNVRYAAYDNLGQSRYYDDEGQKDAAVKLMVETLKADREPVASRAVICRSLGRLGRPEAREAILMAINDEDPLVRAEACRTLGFVGRPEDATMMARTMTADNSGECRIAAIDSIGELKTKDQRIIEYLVAAMEHDDPAIRVASLKALRKVTGTDQGIDALAWKKYVQSIYPPAPKPPGGDAPAVAPIVNGPRPGDLDADPILPR